MEEGFHQERERELRRDGEKKQEREKPCVRV